MTTIDDALEILRETGPEFSSGGSNHGPMATEALLRLGREGAVIPWVEGYKRRLGQHPAALDRVDPGEWRRALGNIERARRFGFAVRVIGPRPSKAPSAAKDLRPREVEPPRQHVRSPWARWRRAA